MEKTAVMTVRAAAHELEGWKKDHHAALRVYDLEMVFRMLVQVFEMILDRDTKMNLLALDDPTIDIEAETKAAKKILADVSATLKQFEIIAKGCNVQDYKDVAINLEQTQEIQARIRDYLDPEPTYLKRSDVRESFKRAEAEFDRGDWKKRKKKGG